MSANTVESPLVVGADAHPPRTRRRAASAALVLTMVTGLFVVGSQKVDAAALTNVSWAVSNNQAGAASNYAFSFKTATTGTIASVKFVISGGTLTGTAAVATIYGLSAGTITLTNPTTITYTVTTPASIVSGIPIFLEVSGLSNPVAGSYTETVTTQTNVPATIDTAATPSVTIAATNTAKTIVVAKSLTFTLVTPTSFQLNMDPSLPALADQSNVTSITVLTNANSGYTLTVADNTTGLQCSCAGNPVLPQVSTQMSNATAFPGAPASTTGYTVTGTGVGDTGFAVNAAFTAGTSYAGYRNAGDIAVSSTKPTGATANAITVTDQTAIDYASSAGSYTDTITYTVTPNYS